MNWVLITVDDLKAVAPGELVAAAQALVLPGQPDPVLAAIADAVAAVRRAVGAGGNALDAEMAAVPGSLRGLTARTTIFALRERMELALTADQRTTRAADAETLQRISEQRIRVEAPDQPTTGGGAAGFIGPVETVAPGNAGHGREELRGI